MCTHVMHHGVLHVREYFKLIFNKNKNGISFFVGIMIITGTAVLSLCINYPC